VRYGELFTRLFAAIAAVQVWLLRPSLTQCCRLGANGPWLCPICHSSPRLLRHAVRCDRDYAAFLKLLEPNRPAGRGQAASRSGSAYRSAFRKSPSPRTPETGRRELGNRGRSRSGVDGRTMSGNIRDVIGCPNCSSPSMTIWAAYGSRGSGRWEVTHRRDEGRGDPRRSKEEPLRGRYTSVLSRPSGTMSSFITLLQRLAGRSAAPSNAISRGSPQPQHRSEYRSLAVIRSAHTT
jgi:hypothetical protein